MMRSIPMDKLSDIHSAHQFGILRSKLQDNGYNSIITLL